MQFVLLQRLFVCWHMTKMYVLYVLLYSSLLIVILIVRIVVPRFGFFVIPAPGFYIDMFNIAMTLSPADF